MHVDSSVLKVLKDVCGNEVAKGDNHSHGELPSSSCYWNFPSGPITWRVMHRNAIGDGCFLHRDYDHKQQLRLKGDAIT